MFDGIDLQSATYYSVVVIYLLGLNDSYNFHLFSILILINLLFFAINNYQKKIFLGDNGVYIFSFILSLLIIQTYQNNYNDIYVENILVILFLPVMDMMRLFFIRLLKNKSPFKADRRHIHHILLKKYGLIQANVLLILPLIFSISLMKYTDINLIFILLMNCIVYFFLLQNSNK
jgi:UDP-GlcNAc:undecaprenyl-phosphate GlcNAc-1-phosphate transferase